MSDFLRFLEIPTYLCMSDVLCTYVWFSLTYLPTQKSVWIISLSIFYELTDFEARFQAFFNLKTALFVNAAQICKIPLKLCKHRQMSATAVHFSMAWTRVVTQGWVKISDTTSLDIWKREKKEFKSGFYFTCRYYLIWEWP